jgi:hypothetical protein
MKFAICGSMHFAKEMLEAQKTLQELGHEANVPGDTLECIENPNLNMDLEHCITTQIDKSCFQTVADSDAILVLNYPKNGMDGYVGGATLMEIGLARHFDKKIFLLNDLPSQDQLRYVLEIKITNPVILQGDITKINTYLNDER